MSEQRKYEFDWNVITGNLETARPMLGSNTRVEVYRLFQFTLRDVLEQHYGAQVADILFREAGLMSGKSFYDHFCHGITDFNSLVKVIQDRFKEFGIGIFRIESVEGSGASFVMTVGEDLDCSGMPDTNDQICVYDEGFIRGIFESFTGKTFDVKEVDCWCTGDRTCRFHAKEVG